MNSEIEEVDDRHLVAQSKAGDLSAFDRLVRRHWRQVYCRVLGYLRDRQETEDVTQETFIRAYHGLARFRGDSAFATWIHPIAFRTALNRLAYLKRRQRTQTVSLDAPLSRESEATLADTIAADTARPDELSVSDEFRSQVSTALDQMKPRQREILILRAVKHRSYGEMAAQLQVSIGTVKSRLARAREVLRRTLPEDAF